MLRSLRKHSFLPGMIQKFPANSNVTIYSGCYTSIRWKTTRKTPKNSNDSTSTDSNSDNTDNSTSSKKKGGGWKQFISTFNVGEYPRGPTETVNVESLFDSSSELNKSLSNAKNLDEKLSALDKKPQKSTSEIVEGDILTSDTLDEFDKEYAKAEEIVKQKMSQSRSASSLSDNDKTRFRKNKKEATSTAGTASATATENRSRDIFEQIKSDDEKAKDKEKKEKESDFGARASLVSLLMAVMVIFTFFVFASEDIELTQEEICKKYFAHLNQNENEHENKNDNKNLNQEKEKKKIENENENENEKQNQNNIQNDNDKNKNVRKSNITILESVSSVIGSIIDYYSFSESSDALEARGLRHLELLKIIDALKTHLNRYELCYDAQKEYEYKRFTEENDDHFASKLEFVNIASFLTSMSKISLSYLPPIDFIRYGDANKFKQVWIYLDDYYEWISIIVTFNIDDIDSKHVNLIAIQLGYKEYFLKPYLNDKTGECEFDGKWEIEVEDFTDKKWVNKIKDKIRLAKKRYIFRLGEKDEKCGVYDSMSLLKYELESHRQSVEERLIMKKEKQIAKQRKKEMKKHNRLYKRVWRSIKTATNKDERDRREREAQQSELNQIKFVLENFKNEKNAAS